MEEYSSLLMRKDNMDLDSAKQHSEVRTTEEQIQRKLTKLGNFRILWSNKRRSKYYKKIR